MVYDRDTGKPKGYAFCEYKDEASAMSAMRNLNDRDLNGRKLRVDFADNNKINMPGDSKDEYENVGGGGNSSSDFSSSGDRSFNTGGGNAPPPTNSNVGGPTPSVAVPRLAPQQQADAIMQILQKLPRNQLHDAVSQMKHIVMTNPEKARQIFAQNPTLAIVMLDIQFILGMVKQPFTPMMTGPPNVPHQAPPFHHIGSAPGPHPGMGVPPMSGPGMMPRGPLAPHPGMGVPPHVALQQGHPGMGMPHGPGIGGPRATGINTSPQPNPYSNPINAPNPQVQEMLKTISQEHLQQLLSLTPQQLDSLDENMRAQVLFIQQQFKGFS